MACGPTGQVAGRGLWVFTAGQVAGMEDKLLSLGMKAILEEDNVHAGWTFCG